jgi:hypothetical protein
MAEEEPHGIGRAAMHYGKVAAWRVTAPRKRTLLPSSGGSRERRLNASRRQKPNHDMGREPDAARAPALLDLLRPDDRLLASAIEIASENALTPTAILTREIWATAARPPVSVRAEQTDLILNRGAIRIVAHVHRWTELTERVTPVNAERKSSI